MKPSCGWSNGVRAVFAKYELDYEDKDIINVSENFFEMVSKTGQRLQPSMEINGEILADVSGEEVEAYLLEKELVTQSSTEVGVPLDEACGPDDVHEEVQFVQSFGGSTQLKDISE
jgi:monothiol glutaredoxin